MGVHDLNDYLKPTGVPGVQMRTCLACSATEPDSGEPHKCPAAGAAKRARRREMAARRLNKILKRRGQADRVTVTCNFCSGLIIPDEPHACMPTPRANGPQYSRNWLASSDWQREAPPLFGNPDNNQPNP